MALCSRTCCESIESEKFEVKNFFSENIFRSVGARPSHTIQLPFHTQLDIHQQGQDPYSMAIESELQRRLTSSLFGSIKPTCVEISRLATVPSHQFNGSDKALISSLNQLDNALYDHKLQNTQSGDVYFLSANLGDYVFFPISCLLKQSELSPETTVPILDVISFLIDNCWVPSGQFTDVMVDQLYPVICYLIRGDGGDVETTLMGKQHGFVMGAVRVLASVTRHLAGDYYETGGKNGVSSERDVNKRLSMLGDTASVFLYSLKSSCNPRDLQQLEDVTRILEACKYLFINQISPDHLAHIFPGIISTLINFVSQSKNLHFDVIIAVIDLMRRLIVKVFNDESLDIQVPNDTPSLTEQWELSSPLNSSTNVEIKVGVENFRSASWLKATSKKLKLSLVTFFKTVLFDKNKNKVSTKHQLAELILEFVSQVQINCFWSLFNDLFELEIDILALFCYVRCFPETGVLDDDQQSQILNESVDVIFSSTCGHSSNLPERVIFLKLEDLVDQKAASILTSPSEERALQFITALKFHILLMNKVAGPMWSKDEFLTRVLIKLKTILVDVVLHRDSEKPTKKEFLKQYTEDPEDFQQHNELDSIQLPPYVNAQNIKKFPSVNRPVYRQGIFADLHQLSKNWDLTTESDPPYFSESLNYSVEFHLNKLVHFIGELCDNKLGALEQLFFDDSPDSLSVGVGLWIAGKLMPREPQFDISEFMNFDNDSNENSSEDMAYLVISISQDLMEKELPKLSEITAINSSASQATQYLVTTKSYSMALDSIGVLTNFLPLEDFKQHVMTDHLFPLFEALTMLATPEVQQHAKRTISRISEKFYDGSVSDLITDNRNYLVDALSLRLSIPGSVTPAILGILLIVLKILGLELLKSNQIGDLVTQMLVLIDSYHGYSVLVESFFIVFTELVKLIKEKYLKTPKISKPVSLYKPWGLKTIQDARNLVDDSGKIFDPYKEYNPNKQYFRKSGEFAGVEDSEDEVDSDDEQAEPEAQSADEVWECEVPKDVYLLVQKIFLYGLQLLSHPSDSLKVQLLQTVIDLYPIVCANYKLVLPIVAENWQSIELLTSLAQKLQTSPEVAKRALNLMTIMIETDGIQQDTFLSKRYIDMATSMIAQFNPTRTSTEIIQINSFKKQLHITVLRALVDFLVAGINTYERVIPDTLALKIMKICAVIGIEQANLGQQAQNIMWVLKTS